jgi:hypothetical protein
VNTLFGEKMMNIWLSSAWAPLTKFSEDTHIGVDIQPNYILFFVIKKIPLMFGLMGLLSSCHVFWWLNSCCLNSILVA